MASLWEYLSMVNNLRATEYLVVFSSVRRGKQMKNLGPERIFVLSPILDDWFGYRRKYTVSTFYPFKSPAPGPTDSDTNVA